MGIETAFAGEPVEDGGADGLIAVGGGVREGPVIREQEEDVRRAFTGLVWLETKPENEWITLVGRSAA